MSRTQTITHAHVNPTRTHDYLYDPTHTLSSERDHARATFQSHTGTDRIKRVPNFKTMFSDLPHYPRQQFHLEVTDPVPRFMSRQWKGYADQAREALVQYKTFNYDPAVTIPRKQFSTADVAGVDRYKFSRRPIIPFLQQVPPEILLQTSKVDPLAPPDVGSDRPITPMTRTVYVQTDYRDSETQTDPYTPEYVIRPGSQPELLTLATLAYGHGLPAGLAEVEMIERARAKRIWEASLPPLNDVDQLEKRRRMMDEQERREWSFREGEIEKLQEARLELLEKILQKREEEHAEQNTKRLDKLWSKKQQDKEVRFDKIQSEHIKNMRKLKEKRRTVEGKLERREVVKDYTDYNSQVYAPMSRIGVFLDRGSEQYNVRSYHLSTYQGLLELEASLPDFVLQPRIQAPKPRSAGKGGFVRRTQRKQKELEQVASGIEIGKKTPEPLPDLKFLVKVEKPVPRPPTPAVDIPSQAEEEEELATIFLQKVIRGRAIQNMMFEGKEKRLELIQELRSTHALQEDGKVEKRNERQAILSLQRQRRLDTHKESYVEEALAQVEGSSLDEMFDFLSKELVRLQEVRRIHAYVMLAERERRMREAEESGLRQVEERRRREEDEIFKQTVKAHQATVNTYLEDIIMDAIDRTADEQARLEIQEQAKKINEVAYAVEKTRTQLQSEEITAELVYSFLLPEVQKRTVKEKVKREQRKHLVAAHNIIHGESEETMTANPESDNPPPKRKPSPAPSEESRSPSVASRASSKGPGSRPGSATKVQTSRPGSVTKQPSRPGSATKEQGSRPGSATKEQGSRPGSATKEQKSRPGSATKVHGSRPGSSTKEKGSRPASGKEEIAPTEDTTEASSEPEKDQVISAQTESETIEQREAETDKTPETST